MQQPLTVEGVPKGNKEPIRWRTISIWVPAIFCGQHSYHFQVQCKWISETCWHSHSHTAVYHHCFYFHFCVSNLRKGVSPCRVELNDKDNPVTTVWHLRLQDQKVAKQFIVHVLLICITLKRWKVSRKVRHMYKMSMESCECVHFHHELRDICRFRVHT
jgi:hypothetical protein